MLQVDVARVREAHERFVTSGASPGRGVRRVVADSWRRSARSGVSAESPLPPVDMAGNALAGYRQSHVLAAAMPVVRDLLVDQGGDWVATLTDDEGRLLWVEGDARVRRSVESVGFVEGALWREDCAGTNAPGTALATGAPVQVVGTEHYARTVQPWNCAAAPVRGPSGAVLGVLDVTGRDVVASRLVMSLVRATAAAAEAEVARTAGPTTGATSSAGHLARPGSGVGPLVLEGDDSLVHATSRADAGAGARDVSRLRVLGDPPVLVHEGRTVRLGLRHAEILLLLSRHPRGLSADELAVLLSGNPLSHVTVRAEISRLRRLVGPLLSGSRPYRLTAQLRSDVCLVAELLGAGDTGAALAAYPGPLLARSGAPGVERLRDELSADVRGAVLASAAPDVVARWVAKDEGADDWQAWERLARVAPLGSPTHARAVSRLDLLARRLG